MKVWFPIAAILVSIPSLTYGRHTQPETVRVASYEQRVVSYRNAQNRQQALTVMRENLADMDEKAALASQQGAKVMVFSEYGITGNMGNRYRQRRSVYPYMEQIPDMSASTPYCVRCNAGGSRKVAQVATGCMALKYSMYVITNLIESVPCDPTTDSQCPSDGHFQYNANIVFDPRGCMVAKYRKYHQWADENDRLNAAPEPMYSYFDTEYGRFGTVICMDAVYEEPAYLLATRYNIDHLLYPTYWDNGDIYAYQSSLDWQLAFATLTNVNFISANIHSAPGATFGSSILSGHRVVNYTAELDKIEGTLIIGDIPTRRPPPPLYQISAAQHDIEKVTQHATASIFGDEFNVVILEGFSGSARVCQNSLCCSVDYRRNSTNEMFVVGAFEGLHTLNLQMYNEVCTVYKCRGGTLSTCGPRELASTTAFSHLKLTGTFSVDTIYPSMIPSYHRYDRLNWNFQVTGASFRNTIVSESSWPLVAVTLTGRVFNRD